MEYIPLISCLIVKSTNTHRNMKTNFKNFQIMLSAMIVMAMISMPLSLNAQGGKANFAGTWAFNAEKSDMGGAPGGQGGAPQGGRMGGFGGGDFTAAQESNLLTVTRTRTNQSGESVTTVSKYTLDGKESVNTTGRGDSKSVATWSADGKTLKIATTSTFDMGGETRTMTSVQEWTLTDAGTLSVKTTSSTPNGERVTTAVYNKK